MISNLIHNNNYLISKILYWLISMPVYIILISCGSGSGSSGQTDNPQIGNINEELLVTPARQAKSVPVNTKITVQFKEAMNIADINKWMVITQGSILVPGTILVSPDSKSASFTPAKKLELNRPYFITLITQDGLIKNKQTGEPFKSPIRPYNDYYGNYFSTFRTVFIKEPTPVPEIERRYPHPDQYSVKLNSSIRLSFNSAMDENSVRESLTLTSAKDGNITGTFVFDSPTNVEFIVAGKLNINDTYTVVVNGIRNTEGTGLLDSTSWDFNTILGAGAPIVTAKFPTPNEKNVQINTDIAIGLSASASGPGTIISRSSVEAFFIVKDELGNTVTGTLEFWNGLNESATFQPTNYLNPGELYTVFVEGIVDSKNIPLEAFTPWTFATSTGPLYKGPTIVAVYPADGSTIISSVSPVIIEVHFSENMNFYTQVLSNELTLSDPTGMIHPVTGKLYGEKNILYFKIDTYTLKMDTIYTVTLDGSISSLKDIILSPDSVLSWQLTTRALKI